MAGGLAATLLAGCGGEASDPGLASAHREQRAARSEDTLITGSSCDALLETLQAEALAELARSAYNLRFTRGSIDVPEVPEVEPESALGQGSQALESLALESLTPPPSVDASARHAATLARARRRPLHGDYVALENDQLYVFDPYTAALRVVDVDPPSELHQVGALPVEGGLAGVVVDHGSVAMLSWLTALPPLVTPASDPSYTPQYAKLALGDGTAQTGALGRELYVEGEAVEIVQQGSIARAVIRQPRKFAEPVWPQIPSRDAAGRSLTPEEIEQQIQSWVESESARIERTRLADYLPAVFEYQAGVPVDRSPACESYHVSPGGGLGALTILGVDLADASAPIENLTLHGSPSAVAFERGSLIVTNTQRPTIFGQRPSALTQLHLFRAARLEPRYVASGRTRGSVGNISERAGLLRATTVSEVYSPDDYIGNSVDVVVLAEEPGQLVELGRSPELANNSASTALFLGDRAYVVADTWSPSEDRYDLVSVDLSDPTAPQLDGRTRILGSIPSLVAVDESHLFGVASSSSDDYAIALDLFAVADPSAPALIAEHVYAGAPNSGAPIAQRWLPERGLLSFPVTDADYDSRLQVFHITPESLELLGAVAPVPEQLPILRCLELLGDATDEASIAALEADPAAVSAVLARCQPFQPGPWVERGVVYGGSAIAIGPRAVAAFALNDLAGAPLKQLNLE